MRKLCVLWGLMLLLAALAAAPARAQAPCSIAARPGSTQLALTSGSLARTAVLHLPPAVPAGQPMPLLIALHGANQDAAFFEPYTGFSRIADAEGFAVLYPNALGARSYWNISGRDAAARNDVQFISDAIDVAASRACIDPSRIYATGVSNGGGMAALLGCELSSRIAAIAPVAGGYRSLPLCRPSTPISVFEVHGTRDGVVPYGGARHSSTYENGQGSVSRLLSFWLARDGCRTTHHVERRVAPQVVSKLWPSCPHGVTIGRLQIVEGEHQLPGGLPPDGGPRSTISAPWLIWRFLRLHHR